MPSPSPSPSSLVLLSSRNSATMVTWRHTSPLYSTKIFGNFSPKLDGSVRSNRKSFEKTCPPFELDHYSWSDRLEFWLNGSRPLFSSDVKKNSNSKSQGLLRFHLHLAKDLLKINFCASFQRDSVFRFKNIAVSNFPSLLRVTLIGTLRSDTGNFHENVAEK